MAKRKELVQARSRGWLRKWNRRLNNPRRRTSSVKYFIVLFSAEIQEMVAKYMIKHMENTGQDLLDVFNLIDCDH